MCDENIAVSIRSLNQMSSIVPNRIEKLKVASLSAGLVAGFTTDCVFNEDLSLAKGYDELVASRVDKLANVLKNYIVLNQTWYNTGAKTISEMRNIFITGRKHPLTTIGNMFALLNHVEQDHPTTAALSLLMMYDINLEMPFYRLLNNTREMGLLKALQQFNDSLIKSAKRINSDGVRLDILDDSKLAVINSTIAGMIIGYAEPLPSTQVDFNNYYATTAYPFGASLVNQLVEKLTIDTEMLFAVYRDTLETRYELAYEPVAIAKGLLSLVRKNEILPQDMSQAIRDANTDELVTYVVGMINGVYAARKDQLERSVLHELDYLAIHENPLADMLNKPESNEDIQARMDELVASAESFLMDTYTIDEKQLREFRRVSVEALSGKQALGIGMMILGGALMAWAVYITFFKQSATLVKKTHDYHEETKKRVEEINKVLAAAEKIRMENHTAFKKRLEEATKRIQLTPALRHTNLTDATVAKKTAETVSKQIGVETKAEKIKMPEVKFTLVGELGERQPDLSVEKITDQLNTFVLYQQAISQNELESYILPEKFKSLKSVNAFDNYMGKVLNDIQIAGKKYRPRPWGNTTGKVITHTQLSKYIDMNLLDDNVSERLRKCTEYAEANVTRTSKIDYEARGKEYEEIIKSAIPDISEEDLKECLASIRDVNKEIQRMYKIMGEAFIWFNKNVLAWDQAAVQHLAAVKTITSIFKVDPATDKIMV